MEILLLVVAFGFGLAAKAVGLPPLVGYLVAGFVLFGFGYESTETVEAISEIGVLLLLFGIGLKLRLRTLIRPEVWGTATAFTALATVIVALLLLGVGALGMPLVRDLDVGSAAVVGFALSSHSRAPCLPSRCWNELTSRLRWRVVSP